MQERTEGNLLGKETSPYLLQHKDNPVHWRAWGDAALAEARATDKPILLSVGYAACHWCHVMAHESFEDAETAARDERAVRQHQGRPRGTARHRRDLHERRCTMLGEQGGWPLTMFLTPDGEPFWGGTYFPPRAALRPARLSPCAERSRARSIATSSDKVRAERRTCSKGRLKPQRSARRGSA